MYFQHFIQVCFYFLGGKTGGGAQAPRPLPLLRHCYVRLPTVIFQCLLCDEVLLEAKLILIEFWMHVLAEEVFHKQRYQKSRIFDEDSKEREFTISSSKLNDLMAPLQRKPPCLQKSSRPQ